MHRLHRLVGLASADRHRRRPSKNPRRQILQNSSRYLIGPWYAGKYHELAPDGYLDLGGTDERAVRLPAMTAMSVASALRLDAYDPKDLSVENATIREMPTTAVRPRG